MWGSMLRTRQTLWRRPADGCSTLLRPSCNSGILPAILIASALVQAVSPGPAHLMDMSFASINTPRYPQTV